MSKKLKMKSAILFFISLCFLYSCSTIRVTKFKASDCNYSCERGLTDYSKVGNKTRIVYGMGDHCCHKFNGDAKLKNDTLFLITEKLGNPCKCKCTYELTYEIKGLEADTYIIKHIRKTNPTYQKKRQKKKQRYLNSVYRQDERDERRSERRKNRKLREENIYERNNNYNDDVYN